MTGYIEEMIEAQNQSRAYPDEEKSIDEILIDELEVITDLCNLPGNELTDIREYLNERIEQLKYAL